MSSLNNPVSAGESCVAKAADQTVNNSTTLVNDTDLKFPVLASSNYEFELFMNILSGSAPDFKYAITLPTGSKLRYLSEHYDNGGAAMTWRIEAPGTTVQHLMGGNITDGTDNTCVRLKGVALIDTTAGSFQLQWAQNTANASDSKVKAGSYLKYRKL